MFNFLQKNPSEGWKFNSKIVFQNMPASSEGKEQNQYLTGAGEVFEKALKDRLSFNKEMMAKFESIAAETKQLDKLTDQMRLEMPSLGNQPNKKQFQCLGQTIEVIMEPTKHNPYQTYLNGQPINFHEWALAEKQKINKPAE